MALEKQFESVFTNRTGFQTKYQIWKDVDQFDVSQPLRSLPLTDADSNNIIKQQYSSDDGRGMSFKYCELEFIRESLGDQLYASVTEYRQSKVILRIYVDTGLNNQLLFEGQADNKRIEVDRVQVQGTYTIYFRETASLGKDQLYSSVISKIQNDSNTLNTADPNNPDTSHVLLLDYIAYLLDYSGDIDLNLTVAVTAQNGSYSTITLEQYGMVRPFRQKANQIAAEAVNDALTPLLVSAGISHVTRRLTLISLEYNNYSQNDDDMPIYRWEEAASGARNLITGGEHTFQKLLDENVLEEIDGREIKYVETIQRPIGTIQVAQLDGDQYAPDHQSINSIFPENLPVQYSFNFQGNDAQSDLLVWDGSNDRNVLAFGSSGFNGDIPYPKQMLSRLEQLHFQPRSIIECTALGIFDAVFPIEFEEADFNYVNRFMKIVKSDIDTINIHTKMKLREIGIHDFDPDRVSNDMLLWLKADEGVNYDDTYPRDSTIWEDQSGNNYDAHVADQAAEGPIYWQTPNINNYTFEFSVIDNPTIPNFFEIDDNIISNESFVTVFIAFMCFNPEDSPVLIEFGDSWGGSNATLWISPDFSIQITGSPVGSRVTFNTSAIAVDDRYRMEVASFEIPVGTGLSQSSIKQDLNNIEEAGSAITEPISTNSDSKTYIGAHKDGTGQFGGVISEIIIYSGQVSDSDREGIHQHLLQKYGSRRWVT